MEQTVNRKKLIFIFIGLMASLLIYAMDSTIFSTAMKKIVADIGGETYYTWPFTSYLLCSTIAIPISGSISDSYGHKRVFLAGVAVFLVGSVLCGISGNIMELIVFRALQGIGGGIIVAGVFTIVADLFPPSERGKYTGIVSSMYGLANLIGPVMGGLISDKLNWRFIFYLNLPIGAFAFLALFFALPDFQPENKKKADRAGMLMLAFALTPLLIALSLSETVFSWDSPFVWGMLLFSVLMIGGFAVVQHHAENPVLSPEFFTNRSISMSLAVSFTNQLLLMGAVIYLPVFEQDVLKMSATASGMVLSPMMISLVLAGNLTGQLISRTGKCRIWSLTGFVIAGFGMWRLSAMNGQTAYPIVLCNAVLLGLGVGANMPVGNVNAQNSVPKYKIGSVTSAVTLFRNIGTATGSALFGSIFSFFRPRSGSSQSMSSPLSHVFQAGILTGVLGILFALFLRDAKLPVPEDIQRPVVKDQWEDKVDD